jgi:hypothetical protein
MVWGIPDHRESFPHPCLPTVTAMLSNGSPALASDGSTRSLHSRGTIEPVELPVKKNQNKKKPPAAWLLEEETVLVDFLLSQSSASGDGNPKATTFTDAAKLLREKFPDAHGAEKTAGVCKSKWQNVCYQSDHDHDQGKLKESMFCSSNQHIMLL